MRLAFVRRGIVVSIVLFGCSATETGGEPEAVGRARSALDAPLPEAFCEIQIQDGPLVDTELDYLPHVIQCEHGGAGIETLKAQAIAARSVAYWRMGTYGDICDSQSCQVYSCGQDPSPIHFQAVEETSGIYLAYNGNVTYGAYLAGDPDTAPPACVGQSESYVTYNEGKTGTDVEQTGLLFIHDPADAAYGQNRGCMSQNGSSCLEDNNGYDYRAILRFYYGADIEMIQAPGPCVVPVPGEGGAGGGPATGTGAVATSGQGPSATGAGTGGSDGTGGAASDGGDEGDVEGCACATAGADGRGEPAILALSLLAALRSRARPRAAGGWRRAGSRRA